MVLESVQRTHGIERLMDYVFYQVAAINGFDAVGHYLRAALIVNQCAVYATRPVGGCSADFSAPRARAAAAPSDPTLARMARVLTAAMGKQVRRGDWRARHRTRERAHRNRETGEQSAAPAAPRSDPAQGLLDYLFGTGGG
jgi:hypothetical protein